MSSKAYQGWVERTCSAQMRRIYSGAGKKKECFDAFAVEKNIESKLIAVIDTPRTVVRGDQALIALFKKEAHDAVATDDLRLARQLKSLNIPYILPGLILYWLLKDGKTDYKTTVWALRQLSEYISDDEFATVRLLMEK